jgi:hypothetical protein
VSADQPTPDLFRREALDHRDGIQRDGTLLWLPPRWMAWGHWTLVAAGVTALALLVCGRVTDYAAGPAIVRVEAGTAPTVLAALPARERFRLAVGQPLELALDGLDTAAHPRLYVEEIGAADLTPDEVRRRGGPSLAAGDATAALVLVRARGVGPTFGDGVRAYRYVDGARGRADIAVDVERLAVLLFPALRSLVGHGR